jgi:hypothetical protein
MNEQVVWTLICIGLALAAVPLGLIMMSLGRRHYHEHQWSIPYRDKDELRQACVTCGKVQRVEEL